MAQANDTRTGGCHCGAVRFQVMGEPNWCANCHCASCRKTTGAAMSTYAGFPRDRFVLLKGKPRHYESSHGVAREFCGDCGTPLTYASVRWPGEIHVLVCNFDDPGAFSPKAHIFTAEKMPWLALNDDLPQFPGFPSETKPQS